MSKPKKERVTVTVPRVLPTPTYNYQLPRHGSVSVRYGEDEEKKRKEASDKQPPSLHNVKFAL